MCLIIQCDDASNILKQITEKEILNAATRNSDGVGVMYIDQSGDMSVHKYTPIMTDGPEVLQKFILEHIELAGDKPFAAHLRMSTHGGNSDENTHPHPIITGEDDRGVRMWLMHNGVIGKYGTFSAQTPDDKVTYSDTARFAQTFLRPLVLDNPEIIHNEQFQKLLSEHVGTHNKLCILVDDGRTVLINDNAGGYRKGVWLSTPSYLGWQHTNTGGSHSGTNTFRQGTNTHGKTRQTGTYTNICTGTHEPLQTYYTERPEIKSVVDAMTLETQKALIEGRMRLKNEPSKDSKPQREAMRRAQMGVKGWSLQQLESFVKSCPIDAAEVLYAMSQVTIPQELVIGYGDEISNLVSMLGFLSFDEMVQLMIEEPDVSVRTLKALLALSYPWHPDYTGKSKSEDEQKKSPLMLENKTTNSKHTIIHNNSKRKGKKHGRHRSHKNR